MQKLVAILLVIVIIYSCKQSNKNSNQASEDNISDTAFTVHAYINGTPNAAKAILIYKGDEQRVDTGRLSGDKFEFKGKVSEPIMGEMFFLDAKNHPSAPLQLILENAFINIEINKDTFQRSRVIGGLQNTDFTSLKKIMRLYWDSLVSISETMKTIAATNDTAQLQKTKTAYAGMQKETRDALTQFAVEHPTSIGSAYFVLEYSHDMTVDQLDTIYHSFDSSILNSIYVKKIKAILDASKRTAIGATAPEFMLNNEKLDTVKLSSAKGKYVLIDFWASWCKECRQQNPLLKKAYNKYRKNGFEIIGVSLDSLKQSWLNAIRQDGLNWKHLSDLKGWNSSVVALYGVHEIPSNFLLDKEGKIIAKNVDPADLEKRLQALTTTK